MATKYEFAIKRETLNSGKEILIPVCRIKNKIPFIENRWSRIVEIYGVYQLQELDFQPELTHDECKNHILGYQSVLSKQKENEVAEVEYDTLEVKEI